jgi:hypothetical protein
MFTPAGTKKQEDIAACQVRLSCACRSRDY